MDDPWYQSFVPRVRVAPRAAKHTRRASLLQQPNESQADVATAEGDGIPEPIREDTLEPERRGLGAPPPATVARRAKSHSDFYDAVCAHVKRETRALKQGIEEEGEKRKSQELGGMETELQFEQWYDGVGDELLDASHDEYALYVDQLHLGRTHLDRLISDTDSTLDVLSSLSDAFKAVETQTTLFQKQCEGLISDQQRITQLADGIEDNLWYYLNLEPITKRLNAPGAGKIVRGREFGDMLSILDKCLEYMQAHPQHVESATYRSRYRLLLTRALTLIRVHFTEALRAIAADVAKRIADRQLNDTTMSALLYAKFRTGAPELKRMGLEIQKRAVVPAGAEPGAEAEYQSLMNELYQSYSTTRGRLILPLVTKKIGEIAHAPSTATDVVAFARSAISYIHGICAEECKLWGEWFDGDDGLYDFLEAMCEPLYDHLRPRTIKETQILKLCELCTLIQTRYIEDEEDEDVDGGDREEDIDPLAPADTRKGRLGFTRLVQPALQDAQSRLVFLSLQILHDDIEKFKPKPEDLDYPRSKKPASSSLSGTRSNAPVLSGTRAASGQHANAPKTPMVVEHDDAENPWGFDTEAAFKDWYPTLRKAIWLLSKIYRLVHSSVFDDLAHRIVHSTTTSLLHASSLLSSSPKTPPTSTDASLFLISHLLLLKQQIVAFDMQFAPPSTELHYNITNLSSLSSISNTFWELRNRGALFNVRNWNLGALFMPRVVENMLDAKSEVDARLREGIQSFTGEWVGRMVGAAIGGGDGKEKEKAVLVREGVMREVPNLRAKLGEYIADARTREMLVAAVMESVVQAYENWFSATTTNPQLASKPLHPNRRSGSVASFGSGAGKGKGKGKGREDDVWEPDMFAEWCGTAFGVGHVGLGIMGHVGDEGEGGYGDGDGRSERSASMSVRTRTTGTGIRIRM